MRQLTTTLVLALSLTGCGSARPEIFFRQDLNDNTDCTPETFLVGQLTGDLALATDEKGISALTDDDGITQLIWPSSYELRWSAGFPTGSVDVVDDGGTVVATTGRRYRIGGQDFLAAGAFWACGGVTPL